jgi:hypothetical protein
MHLRNVTGDIVRGRLHDKMTTCNYELGGLSRGRIPDPEMRKGPASGRARSRALDGGDQFPPIAASNSS